VRVEIGRCYVVLNFEGRRERGRARIGGYTPRRMDRIGSLHELNMPLLSSCALSALVCERFGTTRGYAVAGVFWALVSLAANSPLMGYLVEEQGGLIVPRTDAGLALLLRLPQADWSWICDALLPGARGVGLIDHLKASIDVPDETARAYRDPRQLELGLGAPSAGAAHDAPHERDVRDVRNERDGTVRSAPEPRNEERGRRDQVGSPPLSDDGRNEAAANETSGLVEQYRYELLLYTARGDESRARMAFCAVLAGALGGGVSSSRDRRDWGRTFTALWTRTRGEELPNCEVRRERLDEACCKALEIGQDSGVRNPPAVFNQWLRGVGMRGRPMRA
jgi:hypothetical protein